MSAAVVYSFDMFHLCPYVIGAQCRQLPFLNQSLMQLYTCRLNTVNLNVTIGLGVSSNISPLKALSPITAMSEKDEENIYYSYNST